jgi:hypothetical protein
MGASDPTPSSSSRPRGFDARFSDLFAAFESAGRDVTTIGDAPDFPGDRAWQLSLERHEPRIGSQGGNCREKVVGRAIPRHIDR